MLFRLLSKCAKVVKFKNEGGKDNCFCIRVLCLSFCVLRNGISFFFSHKKLSWGIEVFFEYVRVYNYLYMCVSMYIW